MDTEKKMGILILDVQGNNDQRKGANWEFLYMCLFYMVFTLSDYHFLFYNENTEDLYNSQIRDILKLKESCNFVKNTEIICCFKASQAIKGETLKNKIIEHTTIAKQIFPEFIKKDIYFLKYNEHFDMNSEESCLKAENPYFCHNCKKSEVMEELVKISNIS